MRDYVKTSSSMNELDAFFERAAREFPQLPRMMIEDLTASTRVSESAKVPVEPMTSSRVPVQMTATNQVSDDHRNNVVIGDVIPIRSVADSIMNEKVKSYCMNASALSDLLSSCDLNNAMTLGALSNCVSVSANVRMECQLTCFKCRSSSRRSQPMTVNMIVNASINITRSSGPARILTLSDFISNVYSDGGTWVMDERGVPAYMNISTSTSDCQMTSRLIERAQCARAGCMDVKVIKSSFTFDGISGLPCSDDVIITKQVQVNKAKSKAKSKASVTCRTIKCSSCRSPVGYKCIGSTHSELINTVLIDPHAVVFDLNKL